MITIRKYKDTDFEDLALVHDGARMVELEQAGLKDAFVPFSIAAYEEDLFEYTVFVALENDSAVGFVAFSEDEIGWLYVSVDHMRKGIGRKLISFALEHTHDTNIEVLAKNTSAIAFYESIGFQTIDIKSGPMPGNESYLIDVCIMQQNKK